MAGLDLETCEAQLQKYLTAEAAVLSGQSIQVDGDTMTMADLSAIQSGIRIWNARVQKLSRFGGLAVREVIPR